MSRNDDLEQAKDFVSKAEELVRDSGFDPDEIVTEADVENLAPMDRLYFVNLVLRKLQLAHILLSCEEPIPDPEDPDEYVSFKTNGNILVIYEGGNPVWHMERHGEEWEKYRLYISFSNIEDLEYIGPEKQLRRVMIFIRRLERAENEMKSGDHYFLNPFNPDSDYRFRKKENVIVAYRGDNPVWYLKRENDEWKTHKMTISRDNDADSIEDLFGDLDEWEDELDVLDED